MKTVTIELKKSDYKDIKKRAAKNRLSIADYIMKMYENQTDSFTRGIMLDDAIDQALFECDDVDTVEEVADEITTMVEFKMQDVIAELEEN